MRWPLTAGAILAGLCMLAGCSDTSTRTTGQVDSVAGGRICFTPENADQIELGGCWPIGADDAAKIKQSDCVEAHIPHDATDPVTGVRVLERECHLGVEKPASTTTAIQSVLWFVGLSAVVVFFFVILPRRRRRARQTPADNHTRR